MAIQKKNDPAEAFKKRLFGNVKIPGWLLILYGLFKGIPDFLGEAD